jgi:hypothetical protein
MCLPRCSRGLMRSLSRRGAQEGNCAPMRLRSPLGTVSAQSGSPGGCLSDERQLSPALDITLRSVSAALCTTRRAARTRKSFKLVLTGAELKVCKYREAMEYTMPAQHYLDSMKINNRIIRFAGEAFYVVKWLSRNKIMALVSRAP